MEKDFEQKAKLVRKWSIISTTEAGSGHPTSCLSAADVMTVLFDKYFRYDINNPHNITNDRLIFSKGHAAPLLYTLFALSGALPLEELKTLRKFTSHLEGHPMPAEFPYADVATGSLGQGLSVGNGFSLLAKKEDIPFKTYILLGDGEMAEGSVWEAANFASYYKLDNLVAIADINGLGQSQQTMFYHDGQEYQKRFAAFGWETIVIDGHNFSEITKAFDQAVHNTTGKPFAIIAITEKGKGVSFLEGKEGWHGKPLKKDDLEKALKELGDTDDALRFNLPAPEGASQSTTESKAPHKELTVSYKIGDEVPTREVYGEVLAKLGNDNLDIYAFDAEVKNSTYSIDFKKAHEDRFVECFIAEQNMVGVALGFAKLGKIPFSSTFAAFFTRAFDQIRMAVLSQANMVFVGSHAGVSIGEDGPSQMGLEDMAMFGVLPTSTVLHPSDAVATAKLLPQLVSQKGISYLRTLRSKTPVLYKADESFPIGGSKVLRESSDDVLTIVAAGITVFEALKAHEQLAKEGIAVRVIDCYSIKPIDQKALAKSLAATKEKIIITVEDHFDHGGLGDFVMGALSNTGATIEKMAVTKISRSGTMEELLDDAGISSNHIVAKVKQLLGK